MGIPSPEDCAKAPDRTRFQKHTAFSSISKASIYLFLEVVCKSQRERKMRRFPPIFEHICDQNYSHTVPQNFNLSYILPEAKYIRKARRKAIAIRKPPRKTARLYYIWFPFVGMPSALGARIWVKSQNHQCDKIGQHPVQMGGNAQLRQQIHAVTVQIQAAVGRCDTFEEA